MLLDGPVNPELLPALSEATAAATEIATTPEAASQFDTVTVLEAVPEPVTLAEQLLEPEPESTMCELFMFTESAPVKFKV